MDLQGPEGVCTAGGSSPGASAISEKCVEGDEDELEELNESGSPDSGFTVSVLGMYSRSVSSRLGSVVAL